MAIILPIKKQNTFDTSTSEPPRNVDAPATKAGPDMAGLHDYVSRRTSSRYCPAEQRINLIQAANAQFGFGPDEATHAVDIALEQKGIANEFKLVAEMRSVLLTMAGEQKRLTDKDRTDALEMFVRRGLVAHLQQVADVGA
ncbi:MAG: hypothetical protein ACOYOB_20530, partial [Myxococcota bacterium]